MNTFQPVWQILPTTDDIDDVILVGASASMSFSESIYYDIKNQRMVRQVWGINTDGTPTWFVLNPRRLRG